jgi:hypothetical protein
MARVEPVTHYTLHLSPEEAQALATALFHITFSEDDDSALADKRNDTLCNIAEVLHQAGVRHFENTKMELESYD